MMTRKCIGIAMHLDLMTAAYRLLSAQQHGNNIASSLFLSVATVLRNTAAAGVAR